MGIVSGHRIISKLLAGDYTSGQLETLLGTAANKASFMQALGSASQAKLLAANSAAMTVVTTGALGRETFFQYSQAVGRYLNALLVSSGGPSGPALANASSIEAVAASSAAMTSVAASTAAMTALVASSAAMGYVAASSAAMAPVAASSVAMNLARASVTAKMAFFKSDVALAAIAASSTALTSLRGAGAEYVLRDATPGTTLTSLTSPSSPNAAGSYIAVGMSCGTGNSFMNVTLSTRRTDSTVSMTKAISITADTTGTATACAMPMVTPFRVITTDASAYVVYIGMLRCDV